MKQVLIYKPKPYIESFEAGSCPFCDNTVYVSDFKNRSTFREFIRSGMCQDCQDDCFKSNVSNHDDLYEEVE